MGQPVCGQPRDPWLYAGAVAAFLSLCHQRCGADPHHHPARFFAAAAGGLAAFSAGGRRGILCFQRTAHALHAPYQCQPCQPAEQPEPCFHAGVRLFYAGGKNHAPQGDRNRRSHWRCGGDRGRPRQQCESVGPFLCGGQRGFVELQLDFYEKSYRKI